MLDKIEKWIDQTNKEYISQRISCHQYNDHFNGFYPTSFLNQAYFVITDKIPKPDFPELRRMGLGDFIDMQANGITYKNTYYILPDTAENLRLHFHELVHVAQWRHLGAVNFIQRYISEIQTYGYAGAPLEKMAYALDAHFDNGGEKINIPDYVSANT